MWRAFFLACGISACILGAECLVVDTFVMAAEAPHQAAAPAVSQPATIFGATEPATIIAPQSKNFKPPEWAPWSLLSAGAVVILYSLTLARSGG